MKKFLWLMFIISLSVTCFAQKKTGAKSGAKKPPPTTAKSGPIDDTQMVMTIEHNGEKTEIKFSQFQTHGGGTIPDASNPNRLGLFYGASNNKDDKNFSFQGFIPIEKGTFQIGNGGNAGFTLMTSLFSNVPMFMAKSGTYEITAMPLKGGFVEGIFSVICENVTNEGKIEIYNISGSFKILRN